MDQALIPFPDELTQESLDDWSDDVKDALGLWVFHLILYRDGGIELSLLIVSSEFQGEGRGTKAVQLLTELADHFGRTIWLTPGERDKYHGTTSRKRLIDFYKQFGFVLNRGRKKDFSHREMMYRRPIPRSEARFNPQPGYPLPFAAEIGQEIKNLRLALSMTHEEFVDYFQSLFGWHKPIPARQIKNYEEGYVACVSPILLQQFKALAVASGIPFCIKLAWLPKAAQRRLTQAVDENGCLTAGKEYKKHFERNPLRITPQMEKYRRQRGVSHIVEMHPRTFLELTTDREELITEICRQARTLEEYNSYQSPYPDQTDIYLDIMFLDDSRTIGKVLNHEGRHRACAVLKAGEDSIPVSITFFDQNHRQVKPRSKFPETLISQAGYDFRDSGGKTYAVPLNYKRYRPNPLMPATPGAPPWDSKATAEGVYITSEFPIATQYAEMVAEDTDSVPIVLGIDISGLRLLPDPQAIDLLAEPYQQYRYDVLNMVRDVYSQKLADMVMNSDLPEKQARKQARRAIGPVAQFIKNYVVNPQNYFRSVRAEYPSLPVSKDIKHQDKVMAAKAIFPDSWQLIPAIHEFYRTRAPEIILQWLGLQTDDEENPYGFNSVYLRSNTPLPFSDAFWYYISNFAYIDHPIEWSHIAVVYTPDGKQLYKRNESASDIAYHGTSLHRFNLAFPDHGGQLKLRRNPDERLRKLERAWITHPTWENKLAYNDALMRTGIIPPPDVDVKITWEPYALRAALSHAGPSAKWLPQKSETQRWIRKWFFPNGLGVSIAYNKSDPLPGRAGIATQVPESEHEIEAVAVAWMNPDGSEKPRKNFNHFFGGLDTLDVDVQHVFPAEGVPDYQFFNLTTPRFLLSDNNTLLDILQIISRAKLADDNPWKGTEYG